MGIYANTVSIAQFGIIGETPSSNLFEQISKALAGKGFQSIEETADETTEGWVHTDATDANTFENPATFMRDHYLFFTYRRDQRKISSAVLKSHTARAEAAYLEKNPNMRRPPKQEREDIKERAKLNLLTKTVPTPSTVDAIWDTKTRILTIFSASQSAFDKFEALFVKTFENLRMQLIHPYARGIATLGPQNQERLVEANQANSDSAMSLINDNTWIGHELLAWLLCNGVTGEGEYKTLTPGINKEGTGFRTWVDDKIAFQGGGEGGIQKVVVSGSQDAYAEARSALRTGKNISAATVYIECDENEWKFSLDASTFTFSSFRCPAVKIERGGVEEFSERESAFYERMYLLEQGLQMFDSLLLAFLLERLSDDWDKWVDTFNVWLEGDPASR